MRTFFRTFLAATLALTASAVSAQDPGMQAAQMATQQASQQATMANQQAMQASQQANQQAMQNAQIASDGTGCCVLTASPKFSVAPGTYPGSVVVRLKSRVPRARMFYTTDGWTPTDLSTPYTGPITVSQSETLQAIAVFPGAARSAVGKATYTITAPTPTTASAPAAKLIAPGRIELPQNTQLPLVFTNKLDSETAAIGDTVNLALASDLVVDGVVIAPKGTPAQARVSEVDPARRASVPGIVSFTLVSITINGVNVNLAGTKTREGSFHLGRRISFVLIPGVGAAGLLKKGDPVVIEPNTQVTALVAANTEVPAHPLLP